MRRLGHLSDAHQRKMGHPPTCCKRRENSENDGHSRAYGFAALGGHSIAACFKNRSEPAPVEVRLIVPTTQRRVGQAPIHIRVELWNKGKEDFIAGSELAPIMNARAYLALEFLDNKGNLHQDPGISENFTEKGLNEYWTRIAPGHYYGVEFDLDPYTFPFLETPGTYKMVAKYVSKGGLTASIANPDSLSYRVWEGSITSNSVSLETLAPKK
jgi:hypothetical protein